MLRIVGSFGGLGARKIINGMEDYSSYATQTLRVQLGTIITDSPRTEKTFIRAYYHPVNVALPDALLVSSISPDIHLLSQEQDWQKELKKEYDKFQSLIFIAKRFCDVL